MKAISQRYAQTLVDVAIERGKAEAVRADLGAFVALFTGSGDLRNFLVSPAVARPAKHAVIDKLSTRLGIGKEVSNFFHLLVDNRRTALLAEIQQAFEQVLHARLKVAEAEITSARELTPQERDALNHALEQLLGKRVDAKYGLDPNLLGGARVRVGSTIYDGSVREQLNRLRARLASE